MALRIEALSRQHDRERFDCGSEPLNAYLKQTARQHGERGISQTFVLVEEPVGEQPPILGYFTLSLCQVVPDSLPKEYARKYPRDIYGLRLGRLAIAREHQRRGFGQVLLVEAMKRLLEIHAAAGGIGLFVDAKDEQAKHYYQKHGFEPLAHHPLQLFLPIKTIQSQLLQ